MAPTRPDEMVLTMALVVALWGVTVAQIESSCTNVLISLSPCLDYVTGNASAPSSACCSQLAFVVRSEPQCLCEVVNGGAASSVGLNINQTQALALPGACRVQTPPVSICKATYPPSASSAAGTTSFPSGNGYITFASTSGSGRSSSNGNSSKLPPSLLGIFMFVTCLTFILAKDLPCLGVGGHI